MKKNHSIYVDFNKLWLFFKENKIYVFAIIILLLTIKFDCGWKESKFNFNIQCNPLSINQVKEIITIDKSKLKE